MKWKRKNEKESSENDARKVARKTKKRKKLREQKTAVPLRGLFGV